MMLPSDNMFRQSIRRQIAINQARTPTQRFEALCGLLDVAREMAPKDPAARERRRRAMLARRNEKEQWREQCRRYFASQRNRASTSI
jgi:hypothetical protein